MNHAAHLPSAPVDGRIHPTKTDVTPVMIDLMRASKPWVLFCSILGFMGAGLMGLGGLAMVVVGAVTSLAGSGAALEGMSLGVLSLFYVAMAVPYFLCALHLWRYQSSIAGFVADGGSVSLEDALAHQKAFWKTVGISMITMFGLMMVAMVVTMIAGIAAAL